MNTAIQTFLTQFYWIDVSIAILFFVGFYAMIYINSKKIYEKNKKYNEELKAMRTEIYTEYERNFFL
jgi:hypothetical protein